MKQKIRRQYLANFIPCIGYGLLCGALTGAVIFLFKWCAKQLEGLSRSLYSNAGESVPYTLLIFPLLILLALLLSLLHKKVPECKGGGIPRSEGILRGILPFRWLQTLFGTFFGSMLSFFAGLPVGTEGPAVLIGTSIGKFSDRTSAKGIAWDRYVMTGGAGAGFAVATGAPLSGILFAMEEIHKRFSPILLLTVSTSVLSATFVNRILCELTSSNAELFTISSLPSFQLSHVGYLLLLGILIALAVAIFDASIQWFRKFTKRLSIPKQLPVKLIVVFLISGILCLVLPDGAYSGHHLIDHLLEHDITVLILLLLFIVRMVMMLFITDSGATGGIFIPTLAIGALAAALIAKLLLVFGLPTELSSVIILLGMCAFIGGTLRAPLTASVLFLELTGQFTNLFFVALVVFVVSLLTELLNQTPFYDIALEEMTEAHHHGKKATISTYELIVSKNAFVVGKAVRDILWPHSLVILGISHANRNYLEEMDDGEQRLFAGDKVTVRVCYHDEGEILDLLQELVGTEYDIKMI